MCQAHKSPCGGKKRKKKTPRGDCTHASQHDTNMAGITNICLPLLRLGGMGAAGSYSVAAFVCPLRRRDGCSSPAALSDQIKCVSASLSLSPLTSNKYLGCMPLLSSHTLKITDCLYRHWQYNSMNFKYSLQSGPYLLYPQMISNNLHIAAWIIIHIYIKCINKFQA